MKMGDGNVNLPPGFRFCPTDEELVLHFLYRKASLLPCHPDIIPELHNYPHDPWELDGKALSSGNQWYFFSQKVESQIKEDGFWKQLDIEEPIFTSDGRKVGIKKYLVYYIGESRDGIETNWMMQEYHVCNCTLSGTSHKRNQKLDFRKWVLCRVYQRKESPRQSFNYSDEDDDDDDDSGTELSFLDEMFLSILDEDLGDITLSN